MENWRRHIAKAEGVTATVPELAEMRPLYRSDLRVTVRSVEPLSPEIVKAIADKVRRAYQREVLIEVELDPSLLGGLVVMIGHRVIDMSLATHLRRMSAQIAQRLEDVVKELDQTWERRLNTRMEEFVADMRRRVLELPASEPAPSAAREVGLSAVPESAEVLAAAPAET
ncbi:MAG: F0F1 ATP synthase subunit delta [Bacillota bacterium]|nr:F0F1 ATP synthase subunit delta [Bacillota bacterium]